MRTFLLENCTIVSLDDEGTIIDDGMVVVRDGLIERVEAVPEDPEELEDLEADILDDDGEVVDGDGKILMPALFNGHCHAAMTFERGWAEDLPLDRWFNERIWVAESALQEEDVLWGARLAACEMIRSGVVGFNDHYFYMDRVAETVRDSGMKAGLAWCVFGIGKDKEVGADLAGTLEFVERWRTAATASDDDEASDGADRIRPVLGPHSPYVCPPEFLGEVAAAARDRNLPLHIHVAESPGQVEQCRERTGRTPVGLLAERGILDGVVTLAHGLYLDGDDVALLKERTGVTVARCPITYMKLAMGTTDVSALVEAGVALALGTDGPGSNNDMDMFAVARTFALLQKHVTGDATAAAGDLPLRLATRGAARACGFPESGVVAPGRPADLILVDFERPHLRPVHDVVANLVHCVRGGDVTDVWCNGRRLLDEGELVTMDEAEILAEASVRARTMVGQPLRMVREYRE